MQPVAGDVDQLGRGGRLAGRGDDKGLLAQRGALGDGDGEDQLGRAGELEVEVGGDGAFHDRHAASRCATNGEEGFARASMF